MITRTPRQMVLETGVAWLCNTVQPEGAMPSHHGEAVPLTVDNRRFRFIGRGYADLPVLVVEVDKQEYVNAQHPEGGAYRAIVDGIVPAEMDLIAADLAVIGVGVRSRWNGGENGVPNVSGSFALDVTTHPSHIAGLDRYRAMCPEHRTVFCGGWQAAPGQEDCTWLRTGRSLVVMPTSPYVVEPAGD